MRAEVDGDGPLTDAGSPGDGNDLDGPVDGPDRVQPVHCDGVSGGVVLRGGGNHPGDGGRWFI